MKRKTFVKKSLCFILSIVYLMLCSIANAETAESTKESQFEKISLQTGYLTLKNYVDLGTVKNRFNDGRYDPSFELSSITVLESNTTYYAMRIKALCDGYSSYGPMVGIVDRSEFDDVISTLNYAKEHISELNDTSSLCYVTSSGVTFEITSSEVHIIFSAGIISYIPAKNIDQLINVFNKGIEAAK